MQTIPKFIDYLEFQKSSCLNKADDLKRQDRQDEANLSKIRSNIFAVFISVANVAAKQFADNSNEFICNQIEKLTAEWKASLAEAKHFDDYIKTTQGHIKIDTADEIKAEFMRLLGEGQ